MREIKNYRRFISETGFISRYLDYNSNLETSNAYDFWSAVFLIGAAVGRRLYIPRPGASVHFGWYIVFVAESGTTRKSTAVRRVASLCQRLLSHGGNITPANTVTDIGRTATDFRGQDPWELIESKVTPEELEFRLSTQTARHGSANCAIVVSELVTFLGKEKYTMAMPGLLTDLYDAPSARMGGGTLSRRTEMRNVYMLFLSASTQTWLARAINPDIVEGGFTSRCMFVVSERRKARIPWPDERDTTGQENDLLLDLYTIRQRAERIARAGGLQLTEGGLKRFRSWYMSRRENEDPYRRSFESREDGHILRLAGTLAIDDGSWAIHKKHIDTARTIIDNAKESGHEIFSGGVSTDKLLIGIDKVREQLLLAGLAGISQSRITISVRAYLDSSSVQSLLAIMHELEMVQKFVDKSGVGRATTIWRATKLINSHSVLDSFYRRIKPQ